MHSGALRLSLAPSVGSRPPPAPTQTRPRPFCPLVLRLGFVPLSGFILQCWMNRDLRMEPIQHTDAMRVETLRFVSLGSRPHSNLHSLRLRKRQAAEATHNRPH